MSASEGGLRSRRVARSRASTGLATRAARARYQDDRAQRPLTRRPRASRVASVEAAEAAEARTLEFLHALEQKDMSALADMLDPDVTITHPITSTGNQQPDTVFVGKEQVLDYISSVFQLMSTIEFVDVRLSVVIGAAPTSFVQAYGDFTTFDGRPYNNVYLLRLDWRDGLLVRGEEYFNPVTFNKTFGQ